MSDDPKGGARGGGSPAYLNVLRALLGFAVAAWIIHAIMNAPGVDVVAAFRGSNKRMLVAAVLAYAIGYPLMIVRWRMLLQVQGLHLSPQTMLRLVLIGNFFNLVVPGAVGGDVAKAAVLAGQTPGKRVEALLTIFVDRVLGAVGLLVLAALSVAGSYSFLRQADPRLGVAALAFGLFGLLSICGLWALVWRDRWAHLALAQAARRFVEKVIPLHVTTLARRAVHALDLYRDTPGVLLGGALLSVCVHAVATLVVILLARALGENHVGIAHYLLAVQVANGIAMVPLTPGGLGGRDLIVFLLLSHDGVDTAKAAAIPVMYSAIVTLWALVGGAVFIFDPIRGKMREAAGSQ